MRAARVAMVTEGTALDGQGREDGQPAGKVPTGRADVVAGLTVAAVGVAVTAIAVQYPLGTLRRMGPGYLPVVLGALLVLLGLLIALSRPDAGMRIARQRARPILCVLGSLAVVVAVVDAAGLVPAIMLAVPVAVAAEDGGSLLHSVVLAAAIAALVAAIFVWALGVPLPLVRF
ncbi:MAG: tripartite tricarboxylate transporter TctB family protein [Rhodobacteraceae bacterium]|nr:tripartite tricarboxylate transporter TctB family protein [Paracoccaceae bacterium]